MNPATDFIEALDALLMVAGTAVPDDRDTLVPVGTAIEQALQAAPAESPALEEVLTEVLNALQALYSGTAPDSRALWKALVEGIEAAAVLAHNTVDPSARAECNMTTSVLRRLCPLTSAEGSSAPAPAAAPAPKAAATLPADADLALLKDYVIECMDHITSAEGALLALETNPADAEEINRVFRAFHTIKGTSGLLGLSEIQGLAHLAENMLDRARAGKIQLTGGYADLALQSCDTLKAMIAPLASAQPGQELPRPDTYAELCDDLTNPEAAGFGPEAQKAWLRVGDILVGQAKAEREQVEAAAVAKPDLHIGQALVQSGAAKAADVAVALRTQKQLSGTAVIEQTVRVNTTRLDSLVNMVGELVIAQSMVSQDRDVSGGRMPRLARSVAHAGKIVRELQDLTMTLRMVPLKPTFQKMTRLVRDLAHKSDKSVQFVTEGDETEIDRNMVEVLGDPLVHMIRNSVDHGIEPADVRRAAGKAPNGVVRLRAYHAAGNVVLELADDGKGLDRDRILAKAVERGLVEPGRELSDAEVYDLIFHPGLSTADKITDVSGRGVGMDVVKKGVESVRGRIEVASRRGEGTTFTLRLPLTMAIVDAMLLRVGECRFLLPTVSIEHSFRPQKQALSTVRGKAGEMVCLRGQLLPMFRLHRLFGVSGAQTDPTAGLLIVIETAGRRCALLADELLGQQQVVIKPLGESLQNVPGVAGGAILGDGRVGVILDASGIWTLATEPGLTKGVA